MYTYIRQKQNIMQEKGENFWVERETRRKWKPWNTVKKGRARERERECMQYSVSGRCSVIEGAIKSKTAAFGLCHTQHLLLFQSVSCLLCLKFILSLQNHRRSFIFRRDITYRRRPFFRFLSQKYFPFRFWRKKVPFLAPFHPVLRIKSRVFLFVGYLSNLCFFSGEMKLR